MTAHFLPDRWGANPLETVWKPEHARRVPQIDTRVGRRDRPRPRAQPAEVGPLPGVLCAAGICPLLEHRRGSRPREPEPRARLRLDSFSRSAPVNDKDLFNQTAGMSGPVIAAAFVARGSGWRDSVDHAPGVLEDRPGDHRGVYTDGWFHGAHILARRRGTLWGLYPGCHRLPRRSHRHRVSHRIECCDPLHQKRSVPAAFLGHLAAARYPLRSLGVNVDAPSAAQQDPPLRDEEGRP